MLKRQEELVRRIGNLIRGDWSGNYFDGKDVSNMINDVLNGKLEEVEKQLVEFESNYSRE